MNGMPSAARMSRIAAAWRRALSRLSITQVPPMNTSGPPPPTRTAPIWTSTRHGSRKPQMATDGHRWTPSGQGVPRRYAGLGGNRMKLVKRLGVLLAALAQLHG